MEDLLAVYGPESPRNVTYLFQPPVENLEELIVALKQMLERRFYYAIIDKANWKGAELFLSCVLTKPIAPLKWRGDLFSGSQTDQDGNRSPLFASCYVFLKSSTTAVMSGNVMH